MNLKSESLKSTSPDRKFRLVCLLSLAIGLISLQGLALEAPVKNAQSAVSQAEELILKSKRVDALNLLLNEWQKAKPNAKAALTVKMEELARVFMTERGQVAYELGQSMGVDKGALAEARYQEALKSEDNNVSILMALVALKIREKNWDKALEGLDAVLKLLPANRDAQILRVKTLLAAAKLEEAEAAIEQLPVPAKKTDYDELSVELLLRQEKYPEAGSKLSELLKRQPENPEAHYLKWKLEDLQGQSGQQNAEKYLEICKKSSPNSQKQISQTPFKCLEQLEVAKIIDEFESQTR